jgi:putative membrane protein
LPTPHLQDRTFPSAAPPTVVLQPGPRSKSPRPPCPDVPCFEPQHGGRHRTFLSLAGYRCENAETAHMAQSSQSPSQKLADSAQAIKRSTAQVEDSADRRTVLAADRTMFAAERTYAAWVRTGLFGLASGLGAKAGLAGVVPEWMILANGTLLVLFSAFCFIVAVWHPLRPGPPPPRPDVRRIPPVLLLLVNAFLTLVSFAALAGIWFGRSGGN